VIPAGENSYLVLPHLVNKAVFAINAPGPAAFEFMFQGLRFSGAAEWLPLDIPDQANNSNGLRAIVLNPPSEVLERSGVKFQVSQWFR
jgi:hypothetical protein